MSIHYVEAVFSDTWFSQRNKPLIIKFYGKKFSFIIKIGVVRQYALKMISSDRTERPNFRSFFAAMVPYISNKASIVAGLSA